MKYRVTVKPVEPTEPGHLQFLRHVEVIANDLTGYDTEGNEVYEIEVSDAHAGFVETQLRLADGVIEYEPI